LGSAYLNQGRSIWDGRRGLGGRLLSSPPASRGGGARPRGGELTGDEGRRGSAGPWDDLGGRGGWGGRGEPSGEDWVGAGAPEGGGPRRSGSAVVLRDSGEKLNATGGNKKDGRGRERFLTSRRTPGTPRWRRRRGGSPSRRWRTSTAAQRMAVSAGRGIQGGRGEIGARPGLRTSRRSSPWQRARWGSNGDGETSSGGGGLMAAALWCASSVGKVEGRPAGAQMREGMRASEVLGSSGRGRGGGELHARRGRGVRGTRGSGRRLRGDGRADSSGPRAERAGEAVAGKAVALTSGPARAERGEGEGGRARGDGPDGPKGRGGGGNGLLSFSFYSGICFPFFFLFTLFDSNPNKPQIQISISKNYAPNKSRI
jgi:hypothetical protein